MLTKRRVSFLPPRMMTGEYRFNEAYSRSESAFLSAQDAEKKGDEAGAEHFLNIAVREESKAF